MAADTPLTSGQKKTIAILAAQAWAVLEKCGGVEVPPGQSRAAALADWRHEQQALVLRGARDSLLEARQRDYRALCAHFLALRGGRAAGRAYELEVASSARDEEARQLRFHLGKLAALGGLSHDYLAAIAQDKCGTRDLDSLTPAQLRQMLATARRRVKARLQITPSTT